MKKILRTLLFMLPASIPFTQDKTIPLKDPYEVFPLFYKGIETASRGNFENAQAQFQTVLKIVPWHLEAVLFLKICDDILTKNLKSDRAEKVFRVVNDIKNGQDTSRALGQINEVLKRDDPYFAFYLIRAKLFEDLKNRDQALADFSEAIELKPDYEISLYLRAKFLNSADQRKEALNDYSTALKINSVHLPSLVNRGILYSEMDSLQAAYQDLKLAMNINAVYTKDFRLVEIFNKVGIQYLEEQKNEQAIEALNLAIAVGNDWSEPHLNRGIAHRNLNQYIPALKDFDKAIQLDPNSAIAYYHRGLMHMQRRNFGLAEQDFRQSALLDETNPKVHNILGEIYFKQRRDDEAIQAFKKVLSFDENDPWANYWIGFAFDRKKEFRQALPYYKTFLKSAPSDASIYIKSIKRRVKEISAWLEAQNRMQVRE